MINCDHLDYTSLANNIHCECNVHVCVHVHVHVYTRRDQVPLLKSRSICINYKNSYMYLQCFSRNCFVILGHTSCTSLCLQTLVHISVCCNQDVAILLNQYTNKDKQQQTTNIIINNNNKQQT